MKKIAVAAISLFLTICTQAQTGLQSVEALKPGDAVPDIELNFHFPDSVGKPCHLSDFKGKMILLDTWATDCAPCIESLPHMQMLQEKYGDKLQVIVYTIQDEEKYNKFWKSFTKRQVSGAVINAANKLPAVLGDTILYKLFPSPCAGTKIWIDAAGRYQGITLDLVPPASKLDDLWAGRGIVSDKLFIADIRAGNHPEKWPEKRIGFSDHLLNYSILTRYDEKFTGNGVIFSNQFKTDTLTGKVTGITMINANIKDLYAMVYFKRGIPDNDFLVLSKRPEASYAPSKDVKTYADALNWKQNHLYCYTLQIPPASGKDAFAFMKTELERFFSLKGSIENRNVRCWILKRVTAKDKIRTTDNTAEEKVSIMYDDNGEERFVLKNSDLTSLLPMIQGAKYFRDSIWGPSAITMIDETNYKDKVDIDIPFGRENYSIPRLRKELQKYGLDLVQEYRTRKLLVLREINSGK